MVIGSVFARACARAGLHVFDYTEYPSLIRGGHNVYQVRASSEPVHSQSHSINCLVALNLETIQRHAGHIASGGCLLYDGNEAQLDEKHVRPGVTYLNVPFLQIAREVANERLMMNTVALGASAAAVGMDMRIISMVLDSMFVSKGKKVVELDVKCARAGYDYVTKRLNVAVKPSTLKGFSKASYVLSGVEALAIGAIKAGMKFYAAYPMTPTSGFLSYFAEVAEEYRLVVKQTEDEIAAINMAIGANYAGVRAMTATSGGGFSLMVEGLGLSGMTETPLVVVEGMRGGPSTGLPTWTEQGDLLFVRHAGQGEFPRVVVAPGDVQECMSIISNAFNLAEQYQLPVIVVIDKYLAESHMSVGAFDLKETGINRGAYFNDRSHSSDEAAPRYAVTPSGVSPRLVPGYSKAIFNVASDEHDESGSINEDSDNHIAQMSKRMRKLHELESSLPRPLLFGPKTADITIIGFGSTKGPVLDALTLLDQHGIAANYLHLTYLHPFPSLFVKEALRESKHTLVVEGNYTGQLEMLLKQDTLHCPDFRYRKFDGRPFYAEDIAEQVRQALSHGYRT